MSLFGKTKPTSSFADRRKAWAVRRGLNHIPRPAGYYAELIEKEKRAAAREQQLIEAERTNRFPTLGQVLQLAL